MMNLLNEENPLHLFLNKLGDIIIGNLMFVICSIPIITIGPSLTALYHCMLKSAKGKGGSTVKTFLRAFRDNFLQSLLGSVLIISAGIVLFSNLRFWSGRPGSFAGILYYLSFALLLLLLFLTMYLFPVIAAFHNPLGKQFKNAAVFAMIKFPVTLATSVITVLPIYMTYRDLSLLPLYSFCWFFFGFGLICYLNSMFYYPIFSPYLETAAREE